MPALRRVTVICHQYPPWSLGGLAEYAERSLYHLHRHRRDLELTLYTLNHPGDHPRRSVRDGVIVMRPGIPGWLKRRILDPAGGTSARAHGYFALVLLVFNLRTFLGLCRSRRRGLVVSVHDWQSTPAGILAAVWLRLPVVYHVHNTEQTMTARPDVADRLGIVRVCQRLMSLLAVQVVVPTPEMRSLLVRHGWAGDRIRVVPHGYEDLRVPEPAPAAGGRPGGPGRAAARAEVTAATGFPADAPLLVFAGRLSPVKGIHTLLRAVPVIARRHPRVRLVVLGVGLPGTGQDAAVDRLTCELGIADRTHIYHRYLPRERVRQHFQAADVCVFPSTYEPFGLVSVEAMALGVPVVLGPGFSESISTDGRWPTAYRLVGEEPEELAGLVVRLLDDPASAAEVAARGREYVRRSFTWSACVAETVAVYDAALATRPGP